MKVESVSTNAFGNSKTWYQTVSIRFFQTKKEMSGYDLYHERQKFLEAAQDLIREGLMVEEELKVQLDFASDGTIPVFSIQNIVQRLNGILQSFEEEIQAFQKNPFETLPDEAHDAGPP